LPEPEGSFPRLPVKIRIFVWYLFFSKTVFMKPALFFFSLIILAACNKQYNNGDTGTTQSYAFIKVNVADTSGNCVNVTVNGVYQKGIAMNQDNYVKLQVKATETGIVVLGTDTVNGIWFRDSVLIKNTGDQLVKLSGHGVPNAPIVNGFCTFRGDSTNTCFVVNPEGEVPVISRGDYYPNTFGSNWYHYATGGLRYDSIKATNIMVTKAGKTYQYFEFIFPVPNGKDSLFIRKSGGVYYNFGNGTELFGTNISQGDPIEYPFLKDNVPSGTQWVTDPIKGIYPSGTPIIQKYRFTVLNNDTSFYLNTLYLKHVIIMKMESLVYKNGSYELQGSSFVPTYYAKGLGFFFRPHLPGDTPPRDVSVTKWKIY